MLKALALCVGIVCLVHCAHGFSLEMEISTGPDGEQHVNVIHDDGMGVQNGEHEYGFLSKMRKHMQHIAEVSQHVFHGSPLDGLFDDIDHLFNDRNGNDPLAALHEVAHRTKSDSESTLKHEHFESHPEGPEPMLHIMDMVRQMARPLLASRPTPFNPGPPRGLVALACHRDAVTYCRRFCSCWDGMTKCLSEHVDQLQPQCSHLLEASGVLHKEEPEQPKEPESDKPELEEAPEEQPAEQEQDIKETVEQTKHPLLTGQLPPLSMQATLQQMHDGLVKDLKSTRDAIKRDAEEPVEAPKQHEPKVEAPKDMQPKEVGGEMTEDTPEWITGDIEAPKGEKDMGGWTMRAYTKEQQERLNIDEEGKALPAKDEALIPVENTRESNVPTALSPQSAWLEKAQLQLRAMPVWMVGGIVASLLMVLMLCAACTARSRRHALGGEYARITLDSDISKAQAMTSINQV